MKILIAGATGNLGEQIFHASLKQDFDIIAAAGHIEKLYPYGNERVEFRKIDVTKPDELAGICDGADIVISTVGLSSYKGKLSNMDVDYQGNLNLLNEAKKSNVSKFIYTSVFGVDTDMTVPMLNAKHKFEQELKNSGLPWLIVRPTGFFTDFSMLFLPMAKKGKITLIGENPLKLNPIHPADIAEWICDHLHLEFQTVEMGGPDSMTYREIAGLCFELLGKQPKISSVPAWVFKLMANIARPFSYSKYCLFKFSSWTLTTNFSAPVLGKRKLSDYLKDFIGSDAAQSRL